MFLIRNVNNHPFKERLMVLTMFFLSLVVCFSIIYCLSDDLDADLNIGDSFTVDGIVYHVTAVGEHSEVMVFRPFNPSITEYNGVDTVTWKGITYVVTSIGEGAFENCKHLSVVTIPESVTKLGDYAFFMCTGIKELTVPISIDLTGGYVIINVWTGCHNIEKITFTPGTGIGHDYLKNSGSTSLNPMNLSAQSLNSVVFEEGIKYIGKSTLYAELGDFPALTSIIIPNTVTTIAEFAFYSCSSLTSLTLSESLTVIDNSAFSYCKSLKEITLPCSLEYIDDNAFSYCESLTSLTLPISLNVASTAFSDIWEGCENIEEVTFTPGDGVGYDYGTYTTSGDTVYRAPWYISKDKLTTVIFEEGITHIGSYLLYECDKITSIVIPNTVTSIGESAFEDCTSLTDIALPDSVKDIGKDAFNDCPGYQSDRFYSSCKMDASVHYNCTQMNVGVINLGSVVYRS